MAIVSRRREEKRGKETENEQRVDVRHDDGQAFQSRRQATEWAAASNIRRLSICGPKML